MFVHFPTIKIAQLGIRIKLGAEIAWKKLHGSHTDFFQDHHQNEERKGKKKKKECSNGNYQKRELPLGTLFLLNF